MAGFADKTLWAVAMDNAADVARIVAQAKGIGAGGVAIRTRSAILAANIKPFHDAGLKVYGWRWPAVVTTGGGRYAIDEAKFVADTLIPAGLDGYIADPESEPGSPDNDWSRQDANLPIPVTQLATSMCKIIRDGADKAGRADFPIGLTSGGDYPTSRPHMPWKEFVAGCDALFPQLYWRARNNEDICKTVGDAKPDTRFDVCLPGWRAIAQGKPIIGIAGEISCVTAAAEFQAFAKRAATEKLAGLHFYTSDGHLDDAQMAAIKALQPLQPLQPAVALSAEATDKDKVGALLALGRNPTALAGAKQIAGIVVNRDPNNMHNCCAATLSCLMDFSGMLVGLREEVVDLAPHIEHVRGWGRIAVDQPIRDGDIGVFVGGDASHLHHIYLVLDATDQASPLIADNQGSGAHRRPVKGGAMQGVSNSASPTTYFLRAN